MLCRPGAKHKEGEKPKTKVSDWQSTFCVEYTGGMPATTEVTNSHPISCVNDDASEATLDEIVIGTLHTGFRV
jgi:hypothetical protein